MNNILTKETLIDSVSLGALKVFDEPQSTTYDREPIPYQPQKQPSEETQNKPNGMNLKVILPIVALVVVAGIYFATKKK